MENQNVVVQMIKSGNRFNAFDIDGNKYTSEISTPTRKKAYLAGMALERRINKSGNPYWWAVDMSVFENTAAPTFVLPEDTEENHIEVLDMIHSSFKLKPAGLVMTPLKWKYLIRSAVRGKNILMTGPSGCGKTLAARALVNSLDRPDFYFNMGATQDPRATLIGNTHFDPKSGTYFSEALFVRAIQTPNAVILLDELSRAHPDAWNILMTVLDEGQRYLRLDEASGQETVKVADGVTFIATANIGNEYTAARVMDKALMDRFTIIEMDVLDDKQECSLLEYMFPHVEAATLEAISQIAFLTRTEAENEGKVSSGVSTRTSVEMAGLIFDGFTLDESAEVTIYPQFSADGGVDSERTFVKQLVQKFVSVGQPEEDIFGEVDIDGIPIDATV